jgi:hypothetical protein
MKKMSFKTLSFFLSFFLFRSLFIIHSFDRCASLSREVFAALS